MSLKISNICFILCFAHIDIHWVMTEGHTVIYLTTRHIYEPSMSSLLWLPLSERYSDVQVVHSYVFFWKEQLITYVPEQLWTLEWYRRDQNDLSLFIMYFDFPKTPVCSQFPARGIYSWFITILLNFFVIYHDLTAFSGFVCSCLAAATAHTICSSFTYLYLFNLQ